jgi:hypothetical protein
MSVADGAHDFGAMSNRSRVEVEPAARLDPTTALQWHVRQVRNQLGRGLAEVALG